MARLFARSSRCRAHRCRHRHQLRAARESHQVDDHRQQASMTFVPSRAGALLTISLHLGVLGALLSYAPARTALLGTAPIMVDWIVPAQPVETRREVPKLKPAKIVPKPVETPPVA